MSNDRKFPWLNVWMIVFGALAIWANVAWYSPRTLTGSAEWLFFVSGAIMPVLILLVGLLRFPRSSSEPATDGEALTLGDLGAIYLGAWRKLMRHKWILAIFGSIALVSFLGSLGNMSLRARYLAEYPGRQTGETASVSGILTAIVNATPNSFTQGINRSLSLFHPTYKTVRAGGITFFLLSLVFLVAVIWFQGKLKQLATETEYSTQAKFASYILLPVAIVSWTVALVQAKSLLSWAAMEQHTPQLLFGLVQYIFVAVLAGLLIAGLAGTLLRREQDEPVTGDTFFRDMIRYFKPMLGIYLLIVLVGFLLMLIAYPPLPSNMHIVSQALQMIGTTLLLLLPIATLLLITAPYAAVRQDLGMWDAIRQGISGLRRNAWNAISFIAVGVTFISLVHTIAVAIGSGVRSSDYWFIGGVMSSALTLTASALVAPVMVIAIWDFYVRISEREPEPARVWLRSVAAPSPNLPQGEGAGGRLKSRHSEEERRGICFSASTRAEMQISRAARNDESCGRIAVECTRRPL